MSAVIQHEPEPRSDATALIQAIERAAINPAVDVDKMERLFALQERILARNAEVAFDESLSNVQREMPQVERDAKNDQTGSWYSKLETLNLAIVPVYTKYGFSLSFTEEDCPKEGHIRVVCFCSRAGHTRKYHADVPIDLAGLRGNQNKTHTHAFGSTQSYGRRYLTLLIFNVVMAGEDDDGQKAGGKAPGSDRHNPKPDTGNVDTKLANEYCKKVIAAIEAGKARQAADLRAELSEDAALFTVVWGMLAKPLRDKFQDLLDEAMK
jgi:hypothetical protein